MTRRLRRGTAGPADAGTTLIELLVSMSIFMVLMGIVTGAIIAISQASQKGQNVADSQDQLNAAFLTLDRQVRYASAIDTEGQVGGSWYTEFLTTNTGARVCTQLRLEPVAGLLAERSWSLDAANNPSPAAPGWRTLAGGVEVDPAQQPFTFKPADPTFTRQRLALYLVSRHGAGVASTGSSVTAVQFTAVNSSASTATNSGGLVCSQVPRS